MRDDTHFTTDEEYADIQRKYGGGHVVRRGPEVLASATPLGDLDEQIEAMGIDRTAVVVQYVDRADMVRSG